VSRVARRRLAPRTAVSLLVALLLSAGAVPAGTTPQPPRPRVVERLAADSLVRPAGPVATSLDAFDPAKIDLHLTLVKGGFVDPLQVTSARDGSGRLFVVERAGRIRVISGGNVLATPLLDLRGLITAGGEQGLLGLAFHPNFAAHPHLYVNFTDSNGNTAINRYTIGSNPNVAARSTGVRILTIGQPYSNHNGGNLAFGPEGYLYIGMGDGGSGGDPGNRAQSLNSLLGKILRIDVDHTAGGKRYRVPSTNPYVGKTGLDEIWARGLRNPWRWSFDRSTGNLWIGDVGQDRYEEIDRALSPGSTPAGRGLNFGWRVLEGRACFSPPSGCSTSGKYAPLIVYSHSVTGDDNCSVTGGFVYRGSGSPVLAGGYVYGDFCSGRIWVVYSSAATPAVGTLVQDATDSPHLAISSFGEGDTGELYVTDLNGGGVYQVTATVKP
jgi:glucose/arabinose dehydrogenase